MQGMQLSWEQKLEEAKKAWELEQRSAATSLVDDKWRHLPYLQNVNEDHQLSGVVKLTIDSGAWGNSVGIGRYRGYFKLWVHFPPAPLPPHPPIPSSCSLSSLWYSMLTILSFLSGKHVIGKAGNTDVTIELKGLGIQPKHATIVSKGDKTSIEPCNKKAKVLINGQPCKSKTTLKHMVSTGGLSLSLW